MIKRYSTEDMTRIWSDYNKFNTWKIVELAVVKVMSDKGIIPKESCDVIHDKADFDVERIFHSERGGSWTG